MANPAVEVQVQQASSGTLRARRSASLGCVNDSTPCDACLAELCYCPPMETSLRYSSVDDVGNLDDHGQGDDDAAAWCSVNNLETDCVSPRVSTNSLFSQLDAVTAASLDEVDRASSSGLHAEQRQTPSSDEPPMYSRSARRLQPVATAAELRFHYRQCVLQVQRHLSRQLTSVACARIRADRHSSALPTRSVSCPSVALFSCNYRHYQTHSTGGTLSPSILPVGPVVRPPSAGKDDISAGVDIRDCSGHGWRHVRTGEMDRTADKLTVDDPSALGTGSGTGRLAFHGLASRSSRSASPPVTGVESTGRKKGTGIPGGGMATAGRRGREESGRKSAEKSGGVGSTHVESRTTRNLARTKCMQWLNSFDEDD